MDKTITLGLKPLLWLALLALIFWLANALQPVLLPFLLGMFWAYLGDPVADRLEVLGLSRLWAVSICFLVVLGVLLGVALLLVPMVLHQLKVAYEHVPQLLTWSQQVALPWLIATFDLDAEVFNASYIREQFMQQWGSASAFIGKLLSSASSSTNSLIVLVTNLALVPVVAFYLLRDWDILTAKVFAFIPNRYQAKAALLAKESNDVVGAFLRGQLWVMAALGLIYTLGLWALGLKLALLVGLIAGLASIVPYMGFLVGILVASIAGFMQFGAHWQMLVILAVFLFAQVIESMVLTPLLVGDKIGLHPVAVIFAIMAGGQLFGFMGVLIALPVAAVIVVFLRHIDDFYKDTDFYSEK